MTLGKTTSSFKLSHLLLGNAAVLIGILLFLELAAQGYAYLHPAYEALVWEPDPALGWKLVPNLQWIWAGHYWYARDFSVPVSTNSHGFRDRERAFNKPAETVRVALLGDSFVEALQVPFEKTAGRLLEEKLDSTAAGTVEGVTRYEVLNFGISCHSIGQALLMWEGYASKFAPDYVFLFVGGRQVERTVVAEEFGNFPGTFQRKLRIRPTFRREGDELVREPARDFDAFVEIQQEVMKTQFRGKGFIKRRQGSFSVSFANGLFRLGRRFAFAHLAKTRSKGSQTAGIDFETIQTNLKVLEKLGLEVVGAGARLIIVDASSYLNPNESNLAPLLKEFAAKWKFGYIALSDDLLQAKRKGISVQWKYDPHFNGAGNEIFAEAMYRWMTQFG